MTNKEKLFDETNLSLYQSKEIGIKFGMWLYEKCIQSSMPDIWICFIDEIYLTQKTTKELFTIWLEETYEKDY